METYIGDKAFMKDRSKGAVMDAWCQFGLTALGSMGFRSTVDYLLVRFDIEIGTESTSVGLHKLSECHGSVATYA